MATILHPSIRAALGWSLLLVAAGAAVVFIGNARSADGAGTSFGVAGQPEFERGTLSLTIQGPTSLAFGPDGRLYVASETKIVALTLDAGTNSVLATEQIATGLGGVLGIAFDPTATTLALYASRQEPGATPGYQGAVSVFTAPDWERTDVITGLPSSAPLLNHLTNGLAFDAAGRLFIAQGSNTDAGIPDPPGKELYWPESPLSAAILVADIHAPGFDGTLTYDPAGEPVDHNVDLISGDVAVYAPGLRNAYDLVLHSNGHIYATENGALGQSVSLSCTEDGGNSSTADELNLIEEGSYYGFPNRNRGRFDARQCTYRPPEEASGTGYTAPIAVLPNHCSCDGIAEYTAAAFDGAMLGDLIYVELIRGNVTRAVLSPDGRSVLQTATLAGELDWPLDVTVRADGTIFIAEFRGNQITYLAPLPGAEPSATVTATPVAPPRATATSTPAPTASPTPAATPTPPPAAPAGDADCSGLVNSIDAAFVLQLVAGLIGTVPCPLAADTNGSGEIDAIDATLILQIDAGLLV
ncbi:MAG: PQQ-dependent sugar dehydrogenase [Chloroflexi bacterium]|nr:PQQ-dependent sugar dehydrogenase [Chloroflexota bacterium]